MSKPQRYGTDGMPLGGGVYYLASDIDPILARVEALEECVRYLKHFEWSGKVTGEGAYGDKVFRVCPICTGDDIGTGHFEDCWVGQALSALDAAEGK